MDGAIVNAAMRRRQRDHSLDSNALERTLVAAVVDGASLHGQAPSSLDAAHEAALYHLSTGGQRTRAGLALMAGAALELDDDVVLAIAAAAELLHNASLVHDDMQDRSERRRGHPSVWSMRGTGIALCTGDLMISAAYRALCRGIPGPLLPELLERCHRAVAEAIRGQCGDLAKGGMPCTVAVYCEIASAKSGALLALPVELAMAAADLPQRQIAAAQQAAMMLATAYQIADDLQDIEADTGSGEFAGSLNIVNVLQAEGHGEASVALAITLGRDCIDKARDQLAPLPASLRKGLLAVADRLAGDLRCAP